MDDVDLAILRQLQAHPTESAEELSRRIGLSHTPCWRRIKKLEAAGYILDRAVILNPEKLNLSLTVFAWVKLKQHDKATLESIESSARNCPEIVECFSMTGGGDYIFRILMADVPSYEKFLKNTLLNFPGVAAINSSVALKQVKLTTKIPL
jgi:Lrp/AsnC family transcriptional regulator